MAHPDDAIPLVDVGLDETAAAAKVFKACTESGFFYGTHNCQAGAAAAGFIQALHIYDESLPQLQRLIAAAPSHFRAAAAVTGHGIPEQLLAEVFRQFEAAFALPEGAHTSAVQNRLC